MNRTEILQQLASFQGDITFLPKDALQASMWISAEKALASEPYPDDECDEGATPREPNTP